MNELQDLISAIKGLVDVDDDTLSLEMTNTILNNIQEQFSPILIEQAVNQIINNFEEQRLNKQEATEAINALANTVRDMIYGEIEPTDNKKLIVDTIMIKLYDIFNTAVEKYHSYAIDLRMTVDQANGAKIPTYAHETDAAADLYAPVDQIIPAHSYGNMIKTGVKIQLPEGWLAMILPRSSMGIKTPLRLSNSVGLIDSGYRGELGVIYDNTSDNDYQVNAGDRIAQLLVMPSYRFQAKVVDILADSDRGETGFGDSGK